MATHASRPEDEWALTKLIGKPIGGEEAGEDFILLRGGPGTGKTTLALQIIRHHLEGSERTRAAFVSLETLPQRVLRHAKSAFGIDLETYKEGTPPRLVVFDHKTVQDVVATSHRRQFPRSLVRAIGKRVREKMSHGAPAGSAPAPLLIVVDSLNVLANIVALPPGYRDVRARFQATCEAAREAFGPASVLFTAEYDPLDPRAVSVVSESFFCDIDIQLAAEPVVGRPAGSWPRPPAAGQEAGPLAARFRPPETRHFCRVLKSRTSPNQARRCAYDIVSEKGLVFYETYPGDGQVMLFAENEAQREAWRIFFERDIPQMYPSLRRDSFDRSGLQRTFASQRRFRHIPERADMYLSSFDTYWVSWYVELCQRWDVADHMREVLPCGKPGSSPAERACFSRIVCHTLRECEQWLREAGTPEGKEPDIESLAQGILNVRCKDPSRGDEPSRCASCCGCQTVKEALERAWDHLSDVPGQAGLLRPLPWNNLRLFGERRSGIISELEEYGPEQNRPIHWPGRRPPSKGEKESGQAKILAVPYDANISFLAYRADLLRDVADENPDRLASEIVHVYEEEREAMAELARFYDGEKKKRGEENEEVGGMAKAAAQNLANRFPDSADVREKANALAKRLARGDPPQTWEEVIALCKRTKHLFLIETQTFDTFLCTLLEFLWGCGGDLHVAPDYEVKERAEAQLRLFEAFNLLRILFEEHIIPRNSSLEPAELARRFTGTDGAEKTPDWLFARHWYSTLVDDLTARKPKTNEFLWTPGKIQLEIMPIPVSLSWYIHEDENPTHQSCWGEWYLAVMKGSENQELARDLINNVMSSQKVCDRAFSCAGVPTVEDFYEMYGDVECLNVPERRDIKLPKTTFQQLRDTFFGSARSRSEIYDYRHCMRELHAVLEYIHTQPRAEPKELMAKIEQALERIQALADKEMLLA